MATTQIEWIHLPSAPKMWLSKPIMINESEFIVATEKMQAENNNENEGIFCYNTFSNTWSMFFRYPDNIDIYIEYPTIWLDEKCNILYLHSDRKTLLIINTITKSYDIKQDFVFSGSYAPCIAIHDTFHLIGGDRSTAHLVWNDVQNKPKQFLRIHTFADYTAGCENPGFIHVKSQNMFLLFGGYDRDRHYSVNTEPYKIWYYKYNEMKQGWKQYKNMRMPYNIRLFGFAMTNNEKYIMICGGIKLENKQLPKRIFVIDIAAGTMRQSNVCCPVESAWHSVIMPQNPMDKLLVSGYLKDMTVLNGVKLPKEIRNLIVAWYSSSDVHLLKNGGHWKLSVNYI